jgi:multiple sugar transport system substrate-binding protein
MPYDGDVHIMFWNKPAFERAENKKKFKAAFGYDLAPPQTWKQWDDASKFFHGWGWDGSDRKLFGAGASYKPSGGGYSYYWWRARFFSYGGQYFDADMKPLINSAAGVRALEEMVKTMAYYPPGVLLFESEEPKTMLIKGEVPMLYSWTSTGKRVGNASESLIVGKAGFGVVPGAEIDGKVVHRPSLTPGRAMAVSIYSQKKEPTMKVLELISHPEQSLRIVMDPKTIMDPWRNSHFKAPAFRKAFPGADEYLDAILKTFPLVVPDPIIPGANTYQRKLSFEITEALAGRKQAKAALDTAAAEWDKITDRLGRDKQKALWGEKMGEMKQVGIEYKPDWAQKAK